MVACKQTPYFGHAISTLQPLWFDNLLIESKQTAQYPNLSAVHLQELESMASDLPQIGAAQARAVLAMVKEETYPMDIETRQVSLRSLKVEMNQKSESVFTVQPNPASDHLWITCPAFGEDTPIQITATDVMGRVILIQQYNGNKGLLELNTSLWDPGLFILEFRKGESILGTKKIEIIR